MAEIGVTALVLKMWREMADLTQQQLASLAGLNHTTISEYETGKTVPKRKTIAQVTEALGMTSADREAAESYMHQALSKLLRRPRAEPASSRRSHPEWKEETEQLIQDGSLLMARFLQLHFSLLDALAERQSTGSEP